MGEIRLNLTDLFAVDQTEAPTDPLAELSTVTAYVLEHYAFLPKPLMVSIEGNDVVLRFPDEGEASRIEAARLAARAAKHASEGQYQKAISILNRVLELQPSLATARRDLAMIYMELDDIDSAINHLIEALRLAPQESWSWVVLANLYIGKKSDLTTGEKFLRKALEIDPDDAWALNSLAAIKQQQRKFDEAISLFEKAINSNPEFANPYLGEALCYRVAGNPDAAVTALRRLFSRAQLQDARSVPVFEDARRLFADLQSLRAQREESKTFKVVQDYKAEMEEASGFPVRIQELESEEIGGATILMAWKHARDFHVIKIRRNFPSFLVSHLELHELTHLKLETDARKVGRNRFFATTAETRELAIRSLATDIRKWEKRGYSEQSVTKAILSMIHGLCSLVFNCSLDMIIERYLSDRFQDARPAQFLSVSQFAVEAWQANADSRVTKNTPRSILRASLALNGAYALFLDDLFEGASAFAAPYQSSEAFQSSTRLWKHWQERSKNLEPGDEYHLVDEFAEMVGVRDWYTWKDDPGTHQVIESPIREGTTNAALLAEKHPAAVEYFLDAFKRFDGMSSEQVRDIGFEIAMLGRGGFDYSSSENKYQLKTIPGQDFSGLHLMCLMYAAFKRIAPDQDVGMDLNEPFLAALKQYKTP